MLPSTPLSRPDRGAGSGEDRSILHLTMQLSQDLSLSATSTPNYSDRLLTPPLIADSTESPPYKPCDSDHTSLSMKRRHRSQHYRRRRLNRACVSSGDVDEAPRQESRKAVLHGSLSRYKSAPNLKALSIGKTRRYIYESEVELGDASQKSAKTAEILAARRDTLPKRARRWTVPSKAHPTRSLTSTTSLAEMTPTKQQSQENRVHAPSSLTDQGPETPLATPAMITLQRATGDGPRRPSAERVTYTSFPRPVFNKGSPSFLGSLLNFSGDGRERIPGFSVADMSHGTVGHSSNTRRVSVARNSIVPATSTTAAPVRTEVFLEPRSSLAPYRNDAPCAPRRCSTKYIAGNDVLQVIWDENADTSSSGSESAAATARHSTAWATESTMDSGGRRSSMAMDLLETQMFKAIQQSRQASKASRDTEVEALTGDRVSAAQHQFFDSLFNPDFMREPAEPAGSAVLCSNTSSTPSTTVHIPISTLIQAIGLEENVHFFPPLRIGSVPRKDQTPIDLDLCTAESEAWADDILPIAAQQHRTTLLDAPASRTLRSNSFWGIPQRTRYGSIDVKSRRGTMIGNSTHVRKMSVQKGKSRRASRVVTTSFPADCEHLSLLGYPAFHEEQLDLLSGE